MSDGEPGARHAQAIGMSPTFTEKLELGPAARPAPYLYVVPPNVRWPSQRLGSRFLGGKSTGDKLCGIGRTLCQVFAFERREDSFGKSSTETIEETRDALHRGDVETQTNDHPSNFYHETSRVESRSPYLAGPSSTFLQQRNPR